MNFSFFKPKSESKPDKPPRPSAAGDPAADGQAPAEAMQALKEISSTLSLLDESATNGNPIPAPVAPAASVQNAAVKEEQAKRAHDRSLFKALLNSLYDGILIFDAQGHAVESNSRAEQFFGYGPAEIWMLPCDKLFTGINLRVLNKISSYAKAGRFTVVNATCLRKDGSTFPAEIATTQVDLLSAENMVFSIRNLERREKARERHELELDALKYAGTAIVVCRPDGLIAFVNPAFVQMLKLVESKDVLNHFIGDFCTSQDATNALIKTPSAQSSWLGRLELQTVNGEKLDTLATASLSQRQKDGLANIVIALTPIPRAVGFSLPVRPVPDAPA